MIILIAEDNDSNRVAFKTILERSGVKVVLAKNGTEAAELLGKQHFDALLTDYEMPGLTGIELIRLFRKDHPNESVVLVSGSLNDEVAAEVRSHGGVCLQKPLVSIFDLPKHLGIASS